jgi:hypothetical protein
LPPRGLGPAYGFRCGAGLQHRRPRFIRHLPDLPALPWRRQRTDGANHEH